MIIVPIIVALTGLGAYVYGRFDNTSTPPILMLGLAFGGGFLLAKKI